MFDRIVRCPNCGGIVEFEESFDTYYSDEEITVCCAGGCPDCKRTYLYDEVYKFSHIANIQREE
jgi:hypothetical protein